MSSFNDCIKFSLDIEDQNIVFTDYFKKFINRKFHNAYLAELVQSACPYCRSNNLKHMVIILLTCALLLLMLASRLLSNLESNAFLAMPALKDLWLNLALLINIVTFLTHLNVKY